MKYVFKMPNLLEVNTGKHLMLSHRITLTKQQRELLQTPGTYVETTGFNCPIWVENKETTEPGSEVFCYYRIFAGEAQDRKMFPYEKGYVLYLADRSQRKKLDDFKNGGMTWFSFTLPETMQVDNQTYAVIHQVVISDIEELERSMFAVHLPHISSR
jgi:hypothetical protein